MTITKKGEIIAKISIKKAAKASVHNT